MLILSAHNAFIERMQKVLNIRHGDDEASSRSRYPNHLCRGLLVIVHIASHPFAEYYIKALISEWKSPRATTEESNIGDADLDRPA